MLIEDERLESDPPTTSADRTHTATCNDDPGAFNESVRIYLGLVDQLLVDQIATLDTGHEQRLSAVNTSTDHHNLDRRGELTSAIDLSASLEALIGSGGKRLRPTMAYLGYRVSGGAELSRSDARAPIVTIGAALELLHSFALVHDDVMDESDSRRGHPTIHVQMAQQHRKRNAAGQSQRFGENIAILLGDLAHAQADALIADCSPELRSQWQHLVAELIRGQLGDLTGAADRSRDPENALFVAQAKSGGYTIQRPIELGATAAGAPPAIRDPLSGYGREVGWAFALRDDLLGIWGHPEITGKPSGDDLVAGKPTIIMAIAAQRLAPPDLRLLERTGSPALDPEDVVRLQTAMDERGVRDEVEIMITDHVHRAMTHLSEAETAVRASRHGPAVDEAIAQLATLADHVAWRNR